MKNYDIIFFLYGTVKTHVEKVQCANKFQAIQYAITKKEDILKMTGYSFTGYSVQYVSEVAT